MAINGRDYNSYEPGPGKLNQQMAVAHSKGLNLGKVFGVMFIWLLVTAGIAFGGGYLFANWLAVDFDRAYAGLMLTLIVSGISLIVLTFVIQYFALKKGKGMVILSSIYVILMGIICSSLVLFLDWYILGVAFGITCAIFGVLALIGFLARNIRPIAMIGLMIVIGAAMTALITWIVTLFLPSTTGYAMLWILDFAIFAGMLLLIIVDFNHIGKICEDGEMSRNLTLYCALTLYTDFIYIFIKIAYYLAIATSSNR